MNDLPLSRTGQDPLEVAVRAAREAGDILREYYYRSKQIQSKGKRNLVTEADLLSEQKVINILSAEYPDHGILGEESGQSEQSSEFLWVIDPLDGTTNYTFGIPVFCVSIGLTWQNELVQGVIYDPLRDELFRAQRGGGAFLNDSPIRVARRRDLQTILIGFDLGYDDTQSREMLAGAGRLWSPETALRLIGSAALGITYVACGRLDLYFHRSIYPWDIASAVLLIREAGGEIIDWKGDPATIWSSQVIAAGDLGAYGSILDALR